MKNKAFIISIIIWSIITLVRIFNRIPWYDEAHAWTIAEQLNVFQIIDHMQVEGHLVVWYLLLMPFAKFNIGYPISMQLINWVFCLGALILLWKKAPFNNFIKVLITFSFPFLFMYSVYARCYSIGIFLLFLLTVFFKEKTKKPLLYSTLLALCANTSMMALVGATGFGILFLYDLYKEKINLKSLIPSFLVLLFGAILVLLCITRVDDSAIIRYKGYEFLFDFSNYFLLELSILIIPPLISLILFLKNNKKVLLFCLFTFSILFYTFIFRYYGHLWNHSFMYIYFIILTWLGLSNYQGKEIYKKICLTVLTLISIFLIFVFSLIPVSTFNFVVRDQNFLAIKSIIKDEELMNKPVILLTNKILPYMLLPYKKTEIIDYCNGEAYNYSIQTFKETSHCKNNLTRPKNYKFEYYNYIIDIKYLFDLMKNKNEIYFVAENVILNDGKTDITKDEIITYKNQKYKLSLYKYLNFDKPKSTKEYDESTMYSIYNLKKIK